ncbi:MAG: lytic murein transglycosylase [Acidimicrobiales bacterium]
MRRASAAGALTVALLAAACSSGGANGPTVASGEGPTTTATPTTATTSPATTSTSSSAGAQPRVSSDPAALAAQLVLDEQAIRDTATAPGAFNAAARRAQLAYRVVGRHEEWDAIVLGVVPAALQIAVKRSIDARRQFTAMAAEMPLKDTLPAWRIDQPAATDELLGYYHEAESAFGVGWSYLAAINLVETDLGRIVGLSTAGAQGPMQFLPATWAAFGAGGDINSPHDAILGAARYLAANGFTEGNVDGALRRYNNSEHYVAAVNDYAAALADEPATFAAYHEWDVYYLTVAGDVLLPVGYEQAARVPVADYLATHPQ